MWAVLLLGAVGAGGALATALLVAPVSFVAAASALRVVRSHPGTSRGSPDGEVSVRTGQPRDRCAPARPGRPRRSPGPGGGANLGLAVVSGMAPVAALEGVALLAVVMVLIGLLAAAALARDAAAPERAGRGRSLRRLARVEVAVLAPALASASLVLAVGQGRQEAVVLVCAVLAFDVANCVMGTGATGGLPGALAGGVTLAVGAVVIDAVLVPPFVGASPWVLGVTLAVAAPAGVWLCRRAAPGRLPALRRLDSLVLGGPAWVAVLAFGLHR